MPYALFSNDAKLSKTYPTEADVWKVARKSGLVVDVATEDEKVAPRPVLDNDYEIRPCQAGAERGSRQEQGRCRARSRTEPQFSSSRCRKIRQPPDQTGSAYGVALTSEACSEASVTQALRRCSPLIAPVTLSTLPTGQDASCTKATS